MNRNQDLGLVLPREHAVAQLAGSQGLQKHPKSSFQSCDHLQQSSPGLLVWLADGLSAASDQDQGILTVAELPRESS